MKLRKRIFNKLTRHPSFVEQTNSLVLPTISIIGQRKLRIEQPFQLLLFTDKEIQLLLKNGKIIIKGASFVIKIMYLNEMLIDGKITDIQFINEKNGEII